MMNCMSTCSLNSVASFPFPFQTVFVVCWVQVLQMGVPETWEGMHEVQCFGFINKKTCRW